MSSLTMINSGLLLCMVFGGIQNACGYAVGLNWTRKTPYVSGLSSELPETVADLVTLLSDVNNRVQQLEISHKVITKQETAMKSEIKDIQAENLSLTETINVITDFLRTKGFDLDEILSKKLPRELNADVNGDDFKDSNLKSPGNTTRYSEVTQERIRSEQAFYKQPSVDIRAGSPGENVAFHAVLSRDLVNPGKGYEVVFGDVLTNTGGMYSNNTGTFTCGTLGTYAFFWTVTLASDHWADTHLTRNGQVVGILVAGNAYHYGSYTGTAMVHLDVGDEVFVKVDFHQESTTIYSTASTFSGFKIF
ncbi:uncharacterized protein LOC117336360 [Pecten maximus]|uniref:uncharacterized protein LOC117336360 n=1 Tax=Pecten maximus TaxID=6579 RepID=UPI0014589D21|nr:uncharacterized protein LOC117336360 [Pecten maximus]